MDDHRMLELVLPARADLPSLAITALRNFGASHGTASSCSGGVSDGAALDGADEVLVSSTVKDLVAGSGLRFGDRGSQSLKGVPGEWRIFAVERRKTRRSASDGGYRFSRIRAS
jgi:hypothetical protein